MSTIKYTKPSVNNIRNTEEKPVVPIKTQHTLPNLFNSNTDKVKAMSLNPVLNELLVAYKEKLEIYDLNLKRLIIDYKLSNIRVLKEQNKTSTFKINIKKIEPVIMYNLWLVCLNKTCCTFFTSSLIRSRIIYFDFGIADIVYSHREEEIFLLKNDHKLIKGWGLDFTKFLENYKILQTEGNNLIKDRQNASSTKSDNLLSDAINFEIRLGNHKPNLNLRSNGVYMKLHDDLKLLIVMCENNEILCYNSLGFEVITVVNPSSLSCSDGHQNVSCFNFNQDYLIYTDEKSIVLFDQLKQEEVSRKSFPKKMTDIFKNNTKLIDIDSFYLSESSGTLLQTNDGKIIDYSFKKNAIIDILDLHGPNKKDDFLMDDIEKIDEGDVLKAKSTKKVEFNLKRTSIYSTLENTSKSVISPSDKHISNAKIYKLRNTKKIFSFYCKSGKKSLAMFIDGSISFYEVKTPWSSYCNTKNLNHIQQLLPGIKQASSNGGPPQEECDSNLQVFYNDINLTNIDFSDRKINDAGYIESRLGILYQTRLVDCIGVDQEQKIALETVQSKNSYIHYDIEKQLLFYYANTKITVFNSKNGNVYHGYTDLKDIKICEFMSISYESEDSKVDNLNSFQNQNESQQIEESICIALLVEKHINLFYLDKKLMTVKLINKLSLKDISPILCMKHEPLGRYLVCLSGDGKINYYKDDSLNWTSGLNMIWDKVTCGSFLNVGEVFGGFENGDVQYIKLNNRKCRQENNYVYSFNKAKVVDIKAFRYSMKETTTYFYVRSEDHVQSVWNTNWKFPIKIFNLSESFDSLAIIKPGDKKTDYIEDIAIVALDKKNNSLIKLDNNNCIEINLHAFFKYEKDWKEQQYQRSKIYQVKDKEKKKLLNSFSQKYKRELEKLRSLKLRHNFKPFQAILYQRLFNKSHLSLPMNCTVIQDYIHCFEKKPNDCDYWILDIYLKGLTLGFNNVVPESNPSSPQYKQKRNFSLPQGKKPAGHAHGINPEDNDIVKLFLEKFPTLRKIYTENKENTNFIMKHIQAAQYVLKYYDPASQGHKPNDIRAEIKFIGDFCNWYDLDTEFYTFLRAKVKKIAASQANSKIRIDKDAKKKDKKVDEDDLTEDEDYKEIIDKYKPLPDQQKIEMLKIRKGHSNKLQSNQNENKSLIKLKERGTHFKDVALGKFAKKKSRNVILDESHLKQNKSLNTSNFYKTMIPEIEKKNEAYQYTSNTFQDFCGFQDLITFDLEEARKNPKQCYTIKDIPKQVQKPYSLAESTKKEYQQVQWEALGYKNYNYLTNMNGTNKPVEMMKKSRTFFKFKNDFTMHSTSSINQEAFDLDKRNMSHHQTWLEEKNRTNENKLARDNDRVAQKILKNKLMNSGSEGFQFKNQGYMGSISSTSKLGFFDRTASLSQPPAEKEKFLKGKLETTVSTTNASLFVTNPSMAINKNDMYKKIIYPKDASQFSRKANHREYMPTEEKSKQHKENSDFNYVKTHAEGFKNLENRDLYQHILLNINVRERIQKLDLYRDFDFEKIIDPVEFSDFVKDNKKKDQKLNQKEIMVRHYIFETNLNELNMVSDQVKFYMEINQTKHVVKSQIDRQNSLNEFSKKKKYSQLLGYSSTKYQKENEKINSFLNILGNNPDKIEYSSFVKIKEIVDYRIKLLQDIKDNLDFNKHINGMLSKVRPKAVHDHNFFSKFNATVVGKQIKFKNTNKHIKDIIKEEVKLTTRSKSYETETDDSDGEYKGNLFRVRSISNTGTLQSKELGIKKSLEITLRNSVIKPGYQEMQLKNSMSPKEFEIALDQIKDRSNLQFVTQKTNEKNYKNIDSRQQEKSIKKVEEIIELRKKRIINIKHSESQLHIPQSGQEFNFVFFFYN